MRAHYLFTLWYRHDVVIRMLGLGNIRCCLCAILAIRLQQIFLRRDEPLTPLMDRQKFRILPEEPHLSQKAYMRVAHAHSSNNYLQQAIQ